MVIPVSTGPALVAQRIRASDYGSEGWGFESLRARLSDLGQVLEAVVAVAMSDECQ